MRPKLAGDLWGFAAAMCIGLGLFCYERALRIAIAEESDAGSWEHALDEVVTKTDASSSGK